MCLDKDHNKIVLSKTEKSKEITILLLIIFKYKNHEMIIPLNIKFKKNYQGARGHTEGEKRREGLS